MDRAVGMTAVAIGMRPKSWFARLFSRTVWIFVRLKARGVTRKAPLQAGLVARHA